ncbi:unnamed protein product [Boreogadus saida]
MSLVLCLHVKGTFLPFVSEAAERTLPQKTGRGIKQSLLRLAQRQAHPTNRRWTFKLLFKAEFSFVDLVEVPLVEIPQVEVPLVEVALVEVPPVEVP